MRRIFHDSRPSNESVFLFLAFSAIYVFLAWVVCGGDAWWIIDYVDGSNVFYGDDAYRFFLARSAWLNPDLYTYNFVLPGFLFLDGLVVSLAGGDLLLSRSIHGLLAGVSVAFIWSAGRDVRLSKPLIWAAVLILALMPRFALTSISFYGEAWLTFLLCAAIFFFVRQRFLPVAVLASMFPLVRPDGMFFWLPLWLYMLRERRFSEAAIMVLPGFMYFIYLNLALPSLADYGYWRLELRKILNKLVLNKSFWDWLDTYSLLFVVPCFLGWLYRPLRALWPFLIGSAAWFGWLMILVAGGFSDYEDRYTYMLLPVMALLWAGFFQWVAQQFVDRSHVKLPVHILGPTIALFIVLSHFSNMYMIKGSVKYLGAAETIENIAFGRWEKLFMHDPPEVVESWRAATDKISSMLENDHGIDRVIIFDHVFYYFLDPEVIPDDVIIAYATNGYRVFHILFDGQVFAQHAGGKMYSYFDFYEPSFTESEKRAIYVDLMPLSGYPYSWDFAGHEVHLFAYKDSHQPRKNLDNAPMIDLELMKKAYDKWW